MKTTIAKLMRFKKGVPNPQRNKTKWTVVNNVVENKNTQMWEEIYIIIAKTLKETK